MSARSYIVETAKRRRSCSTASARLDDICAEMSHIFGRCWIYVGTIPS